MRSLQSLILLPLFCTTLMCAAHAVDKLPINLIPIHSDEGINLLRINVKSNTVKLLSHFTTQKNLTYCGIASAVMVLNSSGMDAINDAQHKPYKYFNQDNFFTENVKRIIKPEEVEKSGISLIKLNAAIQAHGLKATPYFSNSITQNQFRQLIVSALNNNDFVIVNYRRSKINQDGGLHHSPIAAYDVQTDQFLILDVSRYKYISYWVKTAELWNGVNVYENDSWHGFIIIERDSV